MKVNPFTQDIMQKPRVIRLGRGKMHLEVLIGRNIFNAEFKLIKTGRFKSSGASRPEFKIQVAKKGNGKDLKLSTILISD